MNSLSLAGVSLMCLKSGTSHGLLLQAGGRGVWGRGGGEVVEHKSMGSKMV